MKSGRASIYDWFLLLVVFGTLAGCTSIRDLRETGLPSGTDQAASDESEEEQGPAQPWEVASISEIRTTIISCPPGVSCADLDIDTQQIRWHTETLFYVFEIEVDFPEGTGQEVFSRLGGALVTDQFGELWRVRIAPWDRIVAQSFGSGFQHFWSTHASENGSALLCSRLWIEVFFSANHIVSREIVIPLPGENEARQFAILYDESYEGPIGPNHVPALGRPAITSAEYLEDADELLITFTVTDDRVEHIQIKILSGLDAVATIPPQMLTLGVLRHSLNEGAPLRTDGAPNNVRLKGSMLGALNLFGVRDDETPRQLNEATKLGINSFDGGQFRGTDRWGEYVHESRGQDFHL